MSLTVSASSNSFELPPVGPVAGRCCRIVDLGSQAGEYQGKPTLKRKIKISWELAESRIDGSAHHIARYFTLSLAENSRLLPFLQAWRGKPFTSDELAGFDLKRLLGAPAMLNIGHTQRNGRDRADILSVSPMPKGMAAPDMTTAPLSFDIDGEDAIDLFDTVLSDWERDSIAKSPEWQTRLKSMHQADREPGSDDDLDDIAF